MRVLIAEPDDFSPEAVALLRRHGEVDLRPVARADLQQAFQEYDVVWFRLAHRIDAEVLGSEPRCKVLATPVTGTDHIDEAALAERGIELVCLRGETEFLRRVRATAELTIALALGLIRHLPAAADSVRAGEWDRDRFRGAELFEKEALVVGMGRLGQIVAGYLRALGMRVRGVDPRPWEMEGIPSVPLHEGLSTADLVTLHVSYTPSTRHLIGPRELEIVKPGAVLVNTSRGGILDERAALEALASGRLGGLALDVLDGEPDVSNHPVVEALRRGEPNLLVVPHIGGNTRESFVKTELFIAEKVLRTLRAATP